MSTPDQRETPSVTRTPSFDFNEAARAALHEFPSLRQRKVAFVDGGNDFAVVSATPERGTRKMVKRYVAKEKAEGPTAVRLLVLHRLAFARFVYFVENDSFLSSVADQTVRKFFIFDHEVGHLVTKRGFQLKTIAGTRVIHPMPENAADAYATLRHLQRSGSPRALEELSWQRTCEAFIGDVSHYTAIAVDKALACDPAALSALAPADVAQLADRFAASYTPPDATLAAMAKLAKGIAKKIKRQTLRDEDIRALAEATVMQVKDPWLFYTGAAFFRDIAGCDITVCGLPISLKGSFWDKVAGRIEGNECPFGNYRNAIPDQPVLEDFLAGNPAPRDREQLARDEKSQRKAQQPWTCMHSAG